MRHTRRHLTLTRTTLLFAVLGTAAARADVTGGTFTATGLDTVPRFFHAASTLPDGTVMVTGGLGLQLLPPSLFSRSAISFFNPASGTFSTSFVPLGGGAAVAPSLLTPRSSHTQTTLRDGRALITGGHVGASGLSPGALTASVEIFSPFTGVLVAGPSMAAPRAMHTATRLPGGAVVVAGGGSWQVFDPVADAWSVNRPLVHARTAHAAVLLPDFAGLPGDDRVLLIGGEGTGPATLEVLDPLGGVSVPLGATLAVGLDDLAATRLPDGRVFIVGGQNVATGDTVATTYLLDPVLDSIAPGPLAPQRPGGLADHQLVRFGPYVFVLGGEQQAAGVDTILDYVGLLDGRTGTWIDAGRMLYFHDDFALAPLAGCRVLLIGGGVPLLGNEAPSRTCEILTVTLADACRPGDLDNDDDVDARDFGALAECLGGPGVGPVYFECGPADLDGDGDVDLWDVALSARASDGA